MTSIEAVEVTGLDVVNPYENIADEETKNSDPTKLNIDRKPNCPGKHGLKKEVSTKYGQFVCDGCGQSPPAPSMIYNCYLPCNWGVCDDCYFRNDTWSHLLQITVRGVNEVHRLQLMFGQETSGKSFSVRIEWGAVLHKTQTTVPGLWPIWNETMFIFVDERRHAHNEFQFDMYMDGEIYQELETLTLAEIYNQCSNDNIATVFDSNTFQIPFEMLLISREEFLPVFINHMFDKYNGSTSAMIEKSGLDLNISALTLKEQEFLRKPKIDKNLYISLLNNLKFQQSTLNLKLLQLDYGLRLGFDSMDHQKLPLMQSSFSMKFLGTCWLKCKLTYLAVDENFETSIAKCAVRMTITLYWLERLHDENFEPKIEFNNAVKVKNSNFGDAQVQKFSMATDYLRDKIEFANERIQLFDDKVFYKTVEYDFEIEEPFELKAFPFDYQDIPLRIIPINFELIRPLVGDQPFFSASSSVTSIRSWVVHRLRIEFDAHDFRLMVKMSRNWRPVCYGLGFLMASISGLSLTSFAVEEEKLPIVLGLVLALIFVDLPNIPIVTFVDEFFYVSFSFLIAVAMFNSFFPATEVVHWMFGIIYVSIQLVFLLCSFLTIYSERKKLNMSSDEISKLDLVGLMTIPDMHHGKCLDLVEEDTLAFESLCEPLAEKIKIQDIVNENMGTSSYEWWLITVVLFVQLGIVFCLFFVVDDSQNCLANNSMISMSTILFSLCVSGISFIILMVINITIGISDGLMNSLVIVLFTLLSVNFCIDILFFSFWVANESNTECIDISTKGVLIFVQALEWVLFLTNDVLFSILAIFPFIAVCIGLAIDRVFDQIFWLTVLSIIGHFFAFGVNIYQLVVIPQLSDECLVDVDILRVNLVESLASVIAQLIMTWILLFIRSSSLVDIGRKATIVLSILVGLLVLLQLGICFHATIFWAQDISCVADGVQYSLLSLYVIWDLLFFVICSLGIYFVVND